MPIWLQILLAAAAVIVSPTVTYILTKRAVARGIDTALAVHESQLKQHDREIVMLREAKHEHANRLTEHGADIYVLKRKAGLA